LLEDLGLTACIPPKANRTDPATYHKGHYKRRHMVENFFQRIKEKLASRFLALVTLAAICDWLR
jgi:transposase